MIELKGEFVAETGLQGNIDGVPAAIVSGAIPIPALAEVGQIIAVSAVDDKGKLTAVEAVDKVVVDATLSNEGQAADAAAVGNALEVAGTVFNQQGELIQQNTANIQQNAADIDALETAVAERVKTVNGAAPDSEGNVALEIGAGCECVADVLAETELAFTAAGTNLTVWQSTETVIPLTPGKLYYVEFAGVKYECIATIATFSGVAGVGIGNASIAGLGDNTNEPFLFGTAVDGSFSACYCTLEGDSHKIALRATKLAGLPGVTTSDNDKILQIVDGEWAVVALENSSVATYIDSYINEALGGEY